MLVSSQDSSRNWDLRCYIRENLINFICANYPDHLPRLRAALHSGSPAEPTATPKSQPLVDAERQPPV